MNYFNFFLFLSFFNTNYFSQSKSIITYNAFSKPVNIAELVKHKIKDEKLLNRLNKTFNSSDSLECILVIENGKSFFFKLDKIVINKKSIVDVLVGNGFYYSDLNDSYVLEEKTTFDKRFLIKHKKSNWQLINQEKKIGKYLCKKAIFKRTIINKEGEFKTDVIAWYAPSIPLNFGPKNFNGLPGLILELTDRQMVYKVAKLELNTNNKKYKIKLPKNDEILTYEEYEKELKSLFNKYKN